MNTHKKKSQYYLSFIQWEWLLERTATPVTFSRGFSGWVHIPIPKTHIPYAGPTYKQNTEKRVEVAWGRRTRVTYLYYMYIRSVFNESRILRSHVIPVNAHRSANRIVR